MHIEAKDIIQFVIAGSILSITLSFFIIAFVFKLKKRKEKHLLEKQHLQSQFQQELLRTQLEIQEQTLNNVSQEIHDNIGQALSLAKLTLSTFTELTDPTLKTKAIDTHKLIAKAIADLRDLSRSLQGGKIAELGLEKVIANELRIIKNTGLYNDASIVVEGSPMTLDPKTEMVLFRMVQEALNNIIKHAKAKNISVTLQFNAPALHLSITDDGAGFDTKTQSPEKTGIGLTNIYARAALINATVSVYSSPGSGTTLSITLQDTSSI